ncbi:DUF6212 domain-containing protein [Methylorubrum populi]|uniref:DUF6212 domain-containing protein n=1 Tax=Methylorubrum populi TaxID=223967 RepID=UPI001FED7692|nr:DUF6212 domain-containing protein [Methylorubrum populi]
MPASKSSEHYIVLSESQIVALRGFEVGHYSEKRRQHFIPRPIVGAILDYDFIDMHPKTVSQLEAIIIKIDGTNPIYEYSSSLIDLQDWLLNRAFSLAARFATDLSIGHIECGRLQQMVQDQFDALQEAQRLVDQAIPLQPRLGVFLPPTSLSVRPSELKGVLSISQNSKREFDAIHAFEIHTAELDRQSDSTSVTIRLRAAHSLAVLATWTVNTRTIVAGWNRFDCPSMPNSLDEPVVIEIDWSENCPPQFALTLGEITADPRLRLVRSDGSKDERSLAVRIYAGIPGLRLPFHGWGRLPDGYDAIEKPNKVIIDELLARAEYFGGLPKVRAGLMRYVDERAGLFLHPVDNGIHIAIIRNVQIADVCAISADVTLAHDTAADTEFGLFAAPVDAHIAPEQLLSATAQSRWTRVERPFRRDTKKTSEDKNFGDRAAWLRLRAREQGQVVFICGDMLGSSFNIYLATRQTGAGTSYAMAHFVHLTAIRERR